MNSSELLAASVVKQIEDADSEAEQAQLAYVLGDFPKLFERKVAAARSRLEDRYRELNEHAAATTKSAQPAGGGNTDLHDSALDSGGGLPTEPSGVPATNPRLAPDGSADAGLQRDR